MKKFLIIFAFIILFFRNELLTGIVYLSNGVETGVKILTQSLCNEEDDACHPGIKEPTQPGDEYFDWEKLTPFDVPPADIPGPQPFPPSDPSFDRKPPTHNISSSVSEPSSPIIPDCKMEDWTQFLEGIQKRTLPCR